MAKKKNKLIVEPFDDIRIIGINTNMIDYQLAWYLNNVLKINLVKYRSISPNDEDYFSFYYYDAGENSNVFNLVALTSSNGKELVSFKPKTDYLLIIRNYILDNVLQQYINDIRKRTKVNHAYVVDLDLNTKIDIILEDIEFHEMDIMNEQNRLNHAFSNCCKNLTSFSK